MKHALALLAVLLVGCDKPADPADPQGYTLRLGVTPAAGQAIQRIDVPPAALFSLTSVDRGDVRLFDAAGRALPFAIVDEAAAGRGEAIRRPAMPIIGPAGALERGDLVLDIDDDAATVRVARGGGGSDEPVVLGALIDVRAIDRPIMAIRLDADQPAGQPILFTIEASPDLAAWRPVAEKTIYRDGAPGGSLLGADAIALSGLILKGEYLRVSWRASPRLIGPVTLRGATLLIEGDRAAEGAPVPAAMPEQVSAREVRFSLPNPTVLTAVHLTLAGGESVVPVRIEARDARDQAWRQVGGGTLRAGPGQAIALDPQSFRAYRILADDRTPGFTKMPSLGLRTAPMTLLAALEGAPPFTLAIGQAGAGGAALPPGDLLPNYRPGLIADLPRAAIAGAPDSIRLTNTEDGPSRRDALLWALLLGGTALLGLMVWSLWRRQAVS